MMTLSQEIPVYENHHYGNTYWLGLCISLSGPFLYILKSILFSSYFVGECVK